MNLKPTTVQPYVVALYRAVFGLLLACHGAATLFGVLGGSFGTGKTTSPLAWPEGPAGLIQLVAGGLVLIGLATRVAALLCSGAMAYAYFTVHLPNGLFPILNGGELAALYSWGFLLIALLGPGAFCLDGLIAKGRRVGAHGSSERRAGERAPVTVEN